MQMNGIGARHFLCAFSPAAPEHNAAMAHNAKEHHGARGEALCARYTLMLFSRCPNDNGVSLLLLY
jgi:hypothetical protein